MTTGGPRRRLTFESWERNVWALALVVFIAFVGFQFFSPFLPLYVIELGISDPTHVALWSGVLTAVTPAVSGLLGPLWGGFADRVGRKMMMIRSLAGFVLIVAAMGLVTSVAQLLALRVLQGVIAGFSVFAMALASVSCPKDKVPVAIGRVQGAQLLSVAIGPAAGGYVASHFGLRYAFFVTAGMCALALVGLIALFTETRQPAPAGPVVAAAEASFTLRQVWTSRGFPLVLALLFVGQFIDRGLSLLVPLKVAALPDVTRVAATAAVSSPLLEDANVNGARGVIINVTGGPDLTLTEVSEASEIIHSAAHEEANIIFGAVVDEKMEGKVKITVHSAGESTTLTGTPRACASRETRAFNASSSVAAMASTTPSRSTVS